MAIRNVVKEGDEVLAKRARAVENFDEKLWSLIDDMLETMYDHDGVGLAAPQVGILRRICVIDIGDGPIELVNPVITKTSGIQEESEGCLSCPGFFGTTRRPMKVTVEAFDRYGKKFKASGSGLLARAFCHEIDHLDGILFKQRLIEENEED